MHQSFVTNALHLPLGNSQANNVSFFSALIKTLPCGDMLMVITQRLAPLNISANTTGAKIHILDPKHSPYNYGENQDLLPCILAQVNDWCINKVVQLMSHIRRKPAFCICKTVVQISCAVTPQLISAFVFTT